MHNIPSFDWDVPYSKTSFNQTQSRYVGFKNGFTITYEYPTGSNLDGNNVDKNDESVHTFFFSFFFPFSFFVVGYFTRLNLGRTKLLPSS